MRRRIFLLFKILLSTTLFFIVITKNNPVQILTIIQSVRIQIYVAAIMIAYATWCIAALKWKVLFQNHLRFSWTQSLKYTFISLCYSTLMPGGQLTGEVGKFLHMKRAHKFDTKKLLITISVDKLLGLSALIAIGFLGTLFDPYTPQFSQTIHQVLIILVGIYLLIIMSDRITSTVKKISIQLFNCLYLQKLEPYTEMLLPVSIKKSSLTQSFLFSLIFQCTIIVILKMLSYALGIPIHFSSLMWIFSLVSMALIIPVSYAGFGIREVGFAYLFSLYGIANIAAVSLSLMLYSVMLVGALTGLSLITHESWIRKYKREYID